MGLLDGKVAIVSGIGPGMGRDISLTLAREGADIAMLARREEKMAEVAAEVEALGRRAIAVPLRHHQRLGLRTRRDRDQGRVRGASTSWSTMPSTVEITSR